MESSRAKKSKVEELQAEKRTEEQLDTMVILEEEEDFCPEPLQVRHPIVDWEVYTDDFAPTWKITRICGETVYSMQFEYHIRSCDRDDLDTLRKMVNDRYMAGKLQDDKEKELWVQFQRLYEPDINDRFWKFQAHD